MKTTKKNTLSNKLENLVKRRDIAKNSIVYGFMLELIEGEKTFRPVYSQGSSWKYSSLIDKTSEFSKILDMLKIEFTLTNDSPRGGKTGALITITTRVI